MFSDGIQGTLSKQIPTHTLAQLGQMGETTGGSRTAVTWHPRGRRPQEPSIAWQVLLRGLLEGVRSSCKSYLVLTPGFTGQGFILMF